MGRSFTPQGGAGTPFEGQELLSTFTCPPLQANTDDYRVANRGFDNASLLLIGATTNINLTGLQGATPNRQVTLLNVSASTITLKNANAGSAPANRFQFGGADVALAQWQSVTLIGNAAAGAWVNGGGGGGGGGAAAAAATVFQAVSQGIAATTPTAITWDSKLFDTSGFWSAGSDTRLTAPAAGLYQVSANVATIADGASGFTNTAFRVNGNSALSYALTVATTGGVASGSTLGANNSSMVLDLNAGDFVEVFLDAQTALHTVVGPPAPIVTVYSAFSMASV